MATIILSPQTRYLHGHHQTVVMDGLTLNTHTISMNQKTTTTATYTYKPTLKQSTMATIHSPSTN